MGWLDLPGNAQKSLKSKSIEPSFMVGFSLRKLHILGNKNHMVQNKTSGYLDIYKCRHTLSTCALKHFAVLWVTCDKDNLIGLKVMPYVKKNIFTPKFFTHPFTREKGWLWLWDGQVDLAVNSDPEYFHDNVILKT